MQSSWTELGSGDIFFVNGCDRGRYVPELNRNNRNVVVTDWKRSMVSKITNVRTQFKPLSLHTGSGDYSVGPTKTLYCTLAKGLFLTSARTCP